MKIIMAHESKIRIQKSKIYLVIKHWIFAWNGKIMKCNYLKNSLVN